ncbi:MAG: alpha/beta hydrolase-fold protein [Dokdonella sp.]
MLLQLVLAALMTACAAGGDVTRPIPTAFIAAPQPAHRLVVMLPGRGDDLASMQRRQVAQTVQSAWPDADVVLTGLTMPFYKEGHAARRLHDEIIAPARARSDYPIWIAGISLGGMGAVLYEHDYPDQVAGMLLLSPYLGENAIHDEIRAAGGLAQWNSGPAQALGPDTFQHELWRTLKGWSSDPARVRSVCLAYGDSEPFRVPIELVSGELSTDHVLMLAGKHDWTLWTPALSALLERAKNSDKDTRGCPREHPCR